jgi:hypothetical protein
VSTAIESLANRPIDEQSFADLFPNVVESIEPLWINPDGSWGSDLRVTFEGDLTQNQAYLARRRMRTTPEGEDREKSAINAYQAIQAFRNIAAPSATQTTNQVKLQAQVIQGLIIMAFPDAATDLGVTF